ncbi:MAG: hypothetical protein ABR878_06520 [Roseiarcus sp.]|jgi:hypothetical protein
MITVTRLSGDDPLAFDVAVAEPSGTSRHRVTLTRAELARLARGRAPERLIEAAFRFLIDREPKESILARFDLSVIGRYFPEFERELPRYLASGE